MQGASAADRRVGSLHFGVSIASCPMRRDRMKSVGLKTPAGEYGVR